MVSLSQTFQAWWAACIPSRKKASWIRPLPFFTWGLIFVHFFGNLGAFLGQLICPLVGDVKDSGGIRDIHAFKWGFLAASIAMLIGTAVFYFLKNKYVVTPEGKPLGGLPKYNDASHYEEGEAQKAVFSPMSLLLAVVAFILLFFVFRYLLAGTNPV